VGPAAKLSCMGPPTAPRRLCASPLPIFPPRQNFLKDIKPSRSLSSGELSWNELLHVPPPFPGVFCTDRAFDGFPHAKANPPPLRKLPCTQFCSQYTTGFLSIRGPFSFCFFRRRSIFFFPQTKRIFFGRKVLKAFSCKGQSFLIICYLFLLFNKFLFLIVCRLFSGEGPPFLSDDLKMSGSVSFSGMLNGSTFFPPSPFFFLCT